ncbi:MAG: universal stress protein [Deltaproteobacteria bacterium]|nr:universal stress protein [Deltaproteobacteria bacterium]
MKILAALDNSDYAFKALRKAVDFVKKENAELTIYSVYTDLLEMEGISLESRESLVQQAEEIVARGKAIAEKADVFVKTVIESGNSPADNIVSYAERNNIEMIVMGHKSRTGLERLLVGSVAVKVVTYAPCSVLVIR